MTTSSAGCYTPCGLEACRTYGCLRKLSGMGPGPIVTQPPGCICPPTSEQTCMNPTCPRKAPQPMPVRYSNATGET